MAYDATKDPYVAMGFASITASGAPGTWKAMAALAS